MNEIVIGTQKASTHAAGGLMGVSVTGGSTKFRRITYYPGKVLNLGFAVFIIAFFI